MRNFLSVSFCAATLLLTSGATPGMLLAQDLLGDFQGRTAGARFGTVARAGDVDADGIADWVVGAPADGTGGPGAGAVRVLSGADGSTLHEWFGAAGDELGFAVTTLGDLDHDGHADLAAGAPGSHGGTTPGFVRLWSGATGQGFKTISGASIGGRFGHALVGLGDIDGDNRPDLAVGAPLEHAASGSTYLLSGGNSKLIGQPLSGAAPGDQFGGALAFDLGGVVSAGDGGGDLVIGATQGGPLEGGATGAGYISLYALPGASLVATVTGTDTGAAFGSALAVVGDLDGDGISDVLAGSTPAGKPAHLVLLSGADGAELDSFDGQAPDGGLALGAVGDLDGDGVPDLAYGEPGSDLNGVDSGALRLRSGADGSLLHVIHGPAAGAGFGASVVAIGDVNGDGRNDLAVGAPLSGTGSAYLLSLRSYQDLGFGLPGTNGVPRLTGTTGEVLGSGGDVLGSGEVTLALSDARASSAVVLVMGTAIFLDAEQGVFAPLPQLVVEGLTTDAEGALAYAFMSPSELTSELNQVATLYHQFQVLDPEAVDGVARSNTVAGLLP